MNRLTRASVAVQMFSVACIIVLLLEPRAAVAQGVTVKLDPAHTEIHFTLGATLHTVHGTFKLKSGAIDFDPSTGKASGEILIDAASGTTGNEGRDHKMRKTILESARYPDVAFVPQQVRGTVALDGFSQTQLLGVMRLHGADHAMVLAVATQASHGTLRATLHFEIPYVQWGLKDPSTFVLRVEKNVAIDVQATGRITATPQ